MKPSYIKIEKKYSKNLFLCVFSSSLGEIRTNVGNRMLMLRPWYNIVRMLVKNLLIDD